MSNDTRMVPVYLLGFVLVIILVLGNVTLAADRTALDSEHTTETLGEENVYSGVTEVVRDDTVERVNQTIEEEKEERIEEQIGAGASEREEEFARQQVNERLPNRTQQREFVEGAITTSFIEGELTRNIETIYAVLNNEQSDGRITVRVGEQKDQLNQSIREALQDDPRIDEEEIVTTISREIPDEENLTEGGEVPSEVESASAGAGLIGTLSWLFPLMALGLVGGIFHFTGRDVRRTARSGGIVFVIGGILGAAIGFALGTVATGAAESALDADSAEVAAMSDGIIAVVDSLFGTIVMQGLLLAAIGLIAVGAVFAEKRGYFDNLLSGDQPPQQGQYKQGQQGQYNQQGQYQQGQYNQQGQYAQQGQHDQQGQYQQGQQGQYNQQGQPPQNQQNQYDQQQYQQTQQGQYDQQPQDNQYEQGQQDGYDETDQSQPTDQNEQQQTKTDESSDAS